MNFTTEIIGEAEVFAALEVLPVEVQLKVKVKEKQTADAILSDAQANCPYDDKHRGSGPHLRDTGHVDETADGYDITFDAHYALFVEEGHHTRSGSFVPAEPFLWPAVMAHSGDIESNLEGALG